MGFSARDFWLHFEFLSFQGILSQNPELKRHVLPTISVMSIILKTEIEYSDIKIKIILYVFGWRRKGTNFFKKQFHYFILIIPAHNPNEGYFFLHKDHPLILYYDNKKKIYMKIYLPHIKKDL